SKWLERVEVRLIEAPEQAVFRTQMAIDADGNLVIVIVQRRSRDVVLRFARTIWKGQFLKKCNRGGIEPLRQDGGVEHRASGACRLGRRGIVDWSKTREISIAYFRGGHRKLMCHGLPDAEPLIAEKEECPILLQRTPAFRQTDSACRVVSGPDRR